MATLKNVLFRDNISDTGSIPSHGSYCGSPDVIVHEDIGNPSQYFVDNYDKYPNKPVDLNKRINYIYTRVKNLTGQKVDGHLSVYASRCNLFLRPSCWKKNILYTPYDEWGNHFSYTKFSAEGNSIAAGERPLILSGVDNTNFCLVGIASDNEGPTIPSDFETYDEFICWIHEEPGVCLRNMLVEYSAELTDYENSYLLEIGSEQPPVALINVIAKGFPKETLYGVECHELRISQEKRTKNKDLDRFAIAIDLPAGFSAAVRVYAKLPAGEKCPVGATVRVEAWPGTYKYMRSYRYGLSVASLVASCDHAGMERFRLAGGRLVKMGECGMVTV